MIELVTGVPGAGKTLLAVGKVIAPMVGTKLTDIDGNSFERRFCIGGISDLILDHEPIDVPTIDPETMRDEWTGIVRRPGTPPVEWVRRVDDFDPDTNKKITRWEPCDQPENVDRPGPDYRRVPMSAACWWLWCQPGDVIVIDECQRLFRPFASGRKIPGFIAMLETHRHYGIDMVLITQHPNLIHSNVRALIGKHRHVRRLVGGMQRVVYEWDRCSSPDKTRDALSNKPWRPDKSTYQLYKSAEIHTKQSFAVSPALVFAFVGLLALPLVLWYSYSRVTSSLASSAAPAAAPVAAASSAAAPAAPAALPVPVVAPGPVVAASAPDAVLAAASAPQIGGCISDRVRCRCWYSDGTIANVARDVCNRVVGIAGDGVPLQPARSEWVAALPG